MSLHGDILRPEDDEDLDLAPKIPAMTLIGAAAVELRPRVGRGRRPKERSRWSRTWVDRRTSAFMSPAAVGGIAFIYLMSRRGVIA